MEKTVKSSSAINKVVSILIAVILWTYVSYQESPETTRWIKNVPITLIGTEALDEKGFSIVETDRTSLDVKLKGDRADLTRIGSGDISVYLDASEVIAAGETTLSCHVSIDKKNVDIADVRKNTVAVTAEKITTDIYPVNASIVGEPSRGYKVFEPSIYPTEVTVRGAESIVSRVASVSTKSVSVNGISRSIPVTVGLTAYDSDGTPLSGVTFEPAAVEVNYTVLKEKIAAINVELYNVPAGKEISYEPAEIKIYASADVLASVTEIKAEAVDASKLKDGDSLNLKLTIPYGVRTEPDVPEIKLGFKVENEEAKDDGQEE